MSKNLMWLEEFKLLVPETITPLLFPIIGLGFTLPLPSLH